LAGPSPVRLVATCGLVLLLASIPFVFRAPATTLSGIRWLALNCEGLALCGSVLDSPQAQIESLASLAGVAAAPGPEWLPAGRAGAWEIFPLEILAVLFPADSSVLASVTAPVRFDPSPGPAVGRTVEVLRISPESVVLVITRTRGGSLAASAAPLLTERR
jgi:hypothetical protein